MATSWEIHPLKLKPDLVWQMAISSLKVRMSRTILTLLTIAASSAFFMYLMTVPVEQDPTERQSWGLMLGALDIFILLSVMIESAILGLIGAAVGIVAGLIISVVLALVAHGFDFLEYLRFGGIFWKLGLAALVGLGLATFGASVPAFIASRMRPIEAMAGEK